MTDEPNERFVRNIWVEYETDSFRKAKLLDISRSGCLLESTQLESIAARLNITILIEDDDAVVDMDEARSMTDMARLFARGQVSRGQVSALAISELRLSGAVVRQESKGDIFALGVRFRYLSRRERTALASYIDSLPVSTLKPWAKVDPDITPLFRVEEQAANQDEVVEEPPDMTKLRFIGSGPVDVSPMAADEAIDWMQDLEERDMAFLLLMRAIRRRASYVALFVVKNERVHGRMALRDDRLDEKKIRQLNFGVRPNTPFAQVLATKTFFVGPILGEDDDTTRLLEEVGGGASLSSTLLLPIVIRDRVVGIALAHHKERSFPVSRVPELLQVADATADAACRYLMALRREEGGKSSSDKEFASVQPGGNVGQRQAPKAQMVEYFAQIESGNPELAAAALQKTLEQPENTLEHLDRHFPGRLNHIGISNAQGSANECGAVLGLVVQLGEAAVELLRIKMEDDSADARFYATLCAGEIDSQELLEPLVSRLIDDVAEVRAIALRALEASSSDLSEVLAPVRNALGNEEDEVAGWALDALCMLGDKVSVPFLIEELEAAETPDECDTLAELLSQLTGASLGASARKWSKWWNKYQAKAHLQWMLGGLKSNAPAVRARAAAVLRHRTGQHFGYDAYRSKYDRRGPLKEWQRFVSRADS